MSTLDIAVAFLVLAFLAVAAGVFLLSIPAGLIVTGVMLAGAGVALLPTGRDLSKTASTKGR